jgi:hypothetical protein
VPILVMAVRAPRRVAWNGIAAGGGVRRSSSRWRSGWRSARYVRSNVTADDLVRLKMDFVVLADRAGMPAYGTGSDAELPEPVTPQIGVTRS